METLSQMMLETPDLNQERLNKLKELFPDLFTGEGKLNEDELKKLISTDGGKETERYDFRWFGKSQAKRNAFTPTNTTLIFDEARSVNPNESENIIIEGENLEVIKLLLCAYREKVKCIYIDPPYNTGKDFVYSDNYTEEKRPYWDKNGTMIDGVKQTTNPDTSGRYHSDWLNMIYSRLLVARSLLKEDGVILISIDDNEVNNLKKICDEVFGENNFIANLIWEKGRKNDSRFFSIGHEYIAVYAKSKDSLKEKNIYWREEKAGAREIYEEYLKLKKKHKDNDEKIEQDLKTFYKNLPKNHPSKKHSRYSNVDERGVWRDDNMTLPRGGAIYDVIHPDTGQPCAIPSAGWRYATIEVMNQKIKDGYVKFRKDHTEPPIRKTYLLRTIEEEIEESIDEESQNDDIGIQVAGTYFYRSGLQATNELENLFGVKKLFNNPKDHEVLARLVKYCTSNDKEALVLDFFAGSGVIGQAIMEPNKEDGGNRKFILVQIPELTDEKSEAFKAGYKKISEITIERNKRVVERIIAKKEAEHPNLFEENKDALKGLGFKVFQLVKSNFPRTEFKPDAKKTDEENIEALKKYIEEKERQQTFDFNIEDLLTEILLKQGFMMNFKIAEQPEFTNNRVIHATDGEKETLICLDEDIKLETIEYLKTHNEQKFICLERALDTTKKWNLNHYLGEKFLAF